MDLRKLFGIGGKAGRSGQVEADLRQAGEWLNAANAENARAWALGEERRFQVDQDQGRIALAFRDGKRAVLPVQIIASFLPGDRSVRWAWANESVEPALAEAAAGLRRYGEAQAVAALTRPELTMPFEEIVNYAALGASRFGCTGLYRCLREDHSTVVVGLGSPALESKEGKPLEIGKLWPKGRATDAFQAAARSLVEAWDAEMFPIDRDYYRLTGADGDADLEAMEAALDAKLAVYRRYWRPRTDSWRPDSVSWRSEHDPVAFLPTLTLPRRSGGCFVVRRPLPHRELAYVVEERDGEPRITDIDLDWGRGLVWIGPAG
jgi:hypothetical protein